MIRYLSNLKPVHLRRVTTMGKLWRIPGFWNHHGASGRTIKVHEYDIVEPSHRTGPDAAYETIPGVSLVMAKMAPWKSRTSRRDFECCPDWCSCCGGGTADRIIL